MYYSKEVQDGLQNVTLTEVWQRIVNNYCILAISYRQWLKLTGPLYTCEESGLFLKSKLPQNISGFGHHCRWLATLNCNHIIDVTRLLTLFTSDQVSLLQFSKKYIGCRERGTKGQTHITTLAHTR